MTEYTTRLSIIKRNDWSHYIGLQFYSPAHDTWMNLKRISKYYGTYEEADQAYKELEKLGYMDPTLYRTAI